MNSKLRAVIVAAVLLVCFYAASRWFVISQRPPTVATTRRAPEPTRTTTKVTKGNFAALQTGMTYKQVTEILGSVDTVKYESKGKTSAGVYQWGTTDSGFIICTFQHDKMIDKTQVSLEH